MSRVQSYSNLPQFNDVTEQRGVLRTKSRVNIPIGSDRSEFVKKIPLKSTSFQTSFRRNSSEFLSAFSGGEHSLSKTQHTNRPIAYKASQKGRSDILPTISSSTAEGYASDQYIRTNAFVASEKGKGDVLPLSTSKIDGYTSDHSWSNSNPLTNVKTISQKLLRRRTSSEVLNLGDNSPRRNAKTSPFDYHENKNHHNIFTKCVSKICIIFKKSDWIQIITFCCVFYIVYDSYLKLVQTSGQLQKLKDEEGIMMLHLHRIEQQSIHLHETMAKISDKASNQGNHDHEKGSPSENLIHTQTQQLYEMEQELDHELHNLQKRLQQAARASIKRQYGDGPIKVVLEMDIPDEAGGNANKISILLWYDTPHAAWTWLKQIQIGEWNGSEFNVGDFSSINSQPVILNAGTLDFLEKSQKPLEPWTVGLTNNVGNLNMFINLKDNSADRKQAVCVGKVIDGFDVIKKIMSASQGEDTRPIRIRQATAALFVRDAASNQNQ